MNDDRLLLKNWYSLFPCLFIRSGLVNCRYTVNGAEYEFFLESLDVSLKWLRDETLRRRKEREGDGFISEYPAR